MNRPRFLRWSARELEHSCSASSLYQSLSAHPRALIGNATHAEHQGAIFDRQGRGQIEHHRLEGYTQPQWVKPFEKTTGCVVNVKYAGSSSEMVSLMANGGGHQWDLVSASGDADLRLIYGGDVKPSTSS